MIIQCAPIILLVVNEVQNLTIAKTVTGASVGEPPIIFMLMACGSMGLDTTMEYGSTPYYVGLTPKKHCRHTLAQILFLSEN